MSSQTPQLRSTGMLALYTFQAVAFLLAVGSGMALSSLPWTALAPLAITIVALQRIWRLGVNAGSESLEVQNFWRSQTLQFSEIKNWSFDAPWWEFGNGHLTFHLHQGGKVIATGVSGFGVRDERKIETFFENLPPATRPVAGALD
jgi:hypothetical protein